MPLPVLFVGNEGIAPAGNLAPARIFGSRLAAFGGINREGRQQSFQILPFTGRARGHVARPHQRLEFVIAAFAAEIVQGHGDSIHLVISSLGDLGIENRTSKLARAAANDQRTT